MPPEPGPNAEGPTARMDARPSMQNGNGSAMMWSIVSGPNTVDREGHTRFVQGDANGGTRLLTSFSQGHVLTGRKLGGRGSSEHPSVDPQDAFAMRLYRQWKLMCRNPGHDGDALCSFSCGNHLVPVESAQMQT